MASAPLLDRGVARWQWRSSVAAVAAVAAAAAAAAAEAALHVGAAVNR